MVKKFDAIVIGTGGGAKLIRPIANLGYTVAAIEHGKPGGTCLNHGCIPSKMLIHPADVIRETEDNHRVNLIGSRPEMDFGALVDRVTRIIDADSASIRPVYDAHPNVTYFDGTARFNGPKTITVNGETLTADRIFVSAGVRPRIPAIPGLADTPYLTHKEALRLRVRPRSLTIIGGGFIALELGHFFAAAGTQVTVLSRSAIMKDYDPDIREEFLTEAANHITFHEGVEFESVSHSGEAFQIGTTIDGRPKPFNSEHLLVASGMIPNTDILNTNQSGIVLTADGSIAVNDRLATSVDGIWAFGDIIGAPYYRHKANFEGEYLFRTLYQTPENTPILYPPVPWAIFSYPQVAGFGLTEAELTQQGGTVRVGKAFYKDCGMGMAFQSRYGFVKLLFDAKTDQLLSAFAVGPQAATMMHLPLAIAHMKGGLSDMLSMIYIHPALPEVVRNAVRKAAATK